MISRIVGKLAQINEQYALVDNNGIFYEVLLPSALADRLKENGRIGGEISFETIYYIEAGDRKSNHYPRIVGFTDPVDRQFFSLFTSVPGLGVKKALKSLILPISEIATAIENKDASRLQRLPGVGGRLAEKIIAELHGKTARFALSKNSEPLAARTLASPPFVEEAIAILEQLQYKKQEAEELVAATVKANPRITRAEDLITAIFKSAQQAGVEQ